MVTCDFPVSVFSHLPGACHHQCLTSFPEKGGLHNFDASICPATFFLAVFESWRGDTDIDSILDYKSLPRHDQEMDDASHHLTNKRLSADGSRSKPTCGQAWQ